MTPNDEMLRQKGAYLMAHTHAATWAGTGPVDPRLVDDLMTGILRAQAAQEHEEPLAQVAAPDDTEGAQDA